MIKPKANNKLKAVLVLIILAIVAISGVVIALNRSESVTLFEDVNNDCSANGISTAAQQKIVEIQVRSNKVDDYLKSAADEGRCVYKHVVGHEQ